MIRDATPSDHAAIRQVVRHAFGQEDEANLVEQLRAEGDALVEMVAASDIAIQGHILYSPLAIERGGETLQATALAPVSVLPAFQKSGIGGDLIRAGMRGVRRWAALRSLCWGTRSIIPASVSRRKSRNHCKLRFPGRTSWRWSSSRACSRAAGECDTRRRLEFEMSARPKTDLLAEVARRYAVAITPAMDALIDAADPNDPIAAQFRPDARELNVAPDELTDPIGDDAHTPVKGVVHRYADRCLLKLVHMCPVYCRFCFRREMVGPQGDGTLTGVELDAALAYIGAQQQIWEVILTGGDPFLLSARRVREITERLAAIDHVKIMRWHTRVPAVDPLRVTPDLVDALRAEDATTYVVLHANHPRELTREARAAIARIVDAGVPMLAQTVLLKGVNDDVETLEALMRGLVEARVKPYYLHQLDKAPGTSHFRCEIARGQELAQELQQRASGLVQPTYVLDIPGGHGKAPLAAPGVRETDVGYEVRDRDGVWRAYRE